MYPILYYNNLNYTGLETKFYKVIESLERGDFKSADVKKLKSTAYFAARLDITNRLLFKPVTYQGRYYLLILEVIRNHDYRKSRFLQGAEVIEADIEFNPENVDNLESIKVDSNSSTVHLLQKFIIFDQEQQGILDYPLPLIIIGSAGSGKTSITLEKLKSLTGNILYTSLSSYLVANARKQYFAHNYDNEEQELDFLSFQEFLETIRIPNPNIA